MRDRIRILADRDPARIVFDQVARQIGGELRDALKLGFYRTVTAAIKPLRSSLAMRRVLRRIALGKRANYYLKGT